MNNPPTILKNNTTLSEVDAKPAETIHKDTPTVIHLNVVGSLSPQTILLNDCRAAQRTSGDETTKIKTTPIVVIIVKTSRS